MIKKNPIIFNAIKLTIILTLALSSAATERIGRLGIGASNHVQSDIPALSIKLQSSRSLSYSAFFGIDTSETGGWNTGLKLFKNIFDEPQLTFYAFGLGALINKKINNKSTKSGFALDMGFGSEFAFNGLESLGFSVDFGVSLKKMDDFSIKTIGDNFVVGSFHFYL